MSDDLRTHRDACPHCGESAGVTFADLVLLTPRRRAILTCDACGQRSQVASETQWYSVLGMAVVLAFWIMLLVVRYPRPGGLIVLLLLPTSLFGGYLTARATLQLVPLDSD